MSVLMMNVCVITESKFRISVMSEIGASLMGWKMALLQGSAISRLQVASAMIPLIEARRVRGYMFLSESRAPKTYTST
jgi:hypothetical protein